MDLEQAAAIRRNIFVTTDPDADVRRRAELDLKAVGSSPRLGVQFDVITTRF